MNNRSGNLWDANSEWWFANISENNFQEYSEIILPLSIQLLAEKKLILDLGTGTGAIAKQISKDPSQTVIGLDISLRQLLGASRNADPRAHWCSDPRSFGPNSGRRPVDPESP